MAWQELSLTTTAEHAQSLGDQLLLLGAEALTLKDAGDQPIYEPALDTTPVWKETIVVGLFDENHVMEPILSYLEKQQTAGILKNIRIVAVADEDWERRCLEDFKPLQFGKRLWICPSWITPPDPTATNIILDPGLAFGTGTHPTTALCLEWLEANFQTTMETVIDYGCGSGILAIAALKLGAKKVLAVDYDPQALLATRRNAETNELSPAQLDVSLPHEFLSQPIDLLMANILAQPLIDLVELFANLIKSNGKILLSGILKEQVEQIKAIYSPWFVMQEPTFKQEWAALAGIRK
jgi:ribosomal protein L11 methyltransferase